MIQAPNALAAQSKADGTTFTNMPPAGNIASTADVGTQNSAVYVLNSGSFAGANGWTITGSGTQVYGIYVLSSGTHRSFFSGSNLSISTNGSTARGAAAAGTNSILILADSTITTEESSSPGLYTITGGAIIGNNLTVTTNGSNSWGAFATGANASIKLAGTNNTISTTRERGIGLYAQNDGVITADHLTVSTEGQDADGIRVQNNSSVSVTNSDFSLEHSSAALVYTLGTGNNTVNLTNVSKVGSGNVLTGSMTAGAANSATLNIYKSNLTGNLWNVTAATSSVKLADESTLAGMSTLSSGTLNVNIDDTSRWDVTGASTLTNLTVEGELGLSLSGISTGTALTTAQMAASGRATLTGGTLDISMSDLEDAAGKTFTLLSYGSGNRVGTFDEFLINGVDVWKSGTAWTFDEIAISGLLVSGNVAYDVDNTLILAITLVVIPEPGTWALMLSGLGVLGYLQRMRRRPNEQFSL